MARLGLLLTATAAIVAVMVPSAQAGQFAAEGFGLAGTPGGSLPGHAFSFFRDGLASACNDGMGLGGSPTGNTTLRAYKSRTFTSVVNEPVCVSMTVTASTCTGTNGELMSETYSPAYDPANITANWIGDLGNYPAGSYSVVVPAGARFETVVDEVNPAANCGGVDVTWSSDRPWAAARPFPEGLPAVGQPLISNFDVWPGTPAVGRQWQRCDAAGANCIDIPGATGQTYIATDADIGHRIGVNESATESGLTSTVTGRTTRTPVFIPAVTREGQSLVAGDSAVQGRLNIAGPPSSCGAPKTVPATTGNDVHFYDTFALTSLINEPACVWVAQIPRTGGGVCSARLTVHSPAFDPTDLRKGYVADDSGQGTLSYTLAPGASADAVIFDDGTFHGCTDYGLLFGSDAPFASARPELGGGATEGAPVTTTNGAWGSAPTFAYGWRRCDASGAGCVPIDGATSSSYTPTGADVGSTLRSRVTATQGGQSASADSAPSAVVGAAPGGPGGPSGGGGPGGPGGDADRTGPKARLALKRTTLQKVVKSGYLPVTVTCDEACTITLRADVARKLRRPLGGVKIASGKGKAVAGRRKTFKVKLTRKARRALRQAQVDRLHAQGHRRRRRGQPRRGEQKGQGQAQVRLRRHLLAAGLAAGALLGPAAVAAQAVVIVNATNVSVPSQAGRCRTGASTPTTPRAAAGRSTSSRRSPSRGRRSSTPTTPSVAA